MDDQAIIDLRANRMSYREIGKIIGVSGEWVRQILEKHGAAGRLPRLSRIKPPKPTKEEKFWARVDRSNPDGCWEWQASRTPAGYGHLKSGVDEYAHRSAWIYTHGPIPDGLHVCHKCDNPPCCNPAHLFLGTPKDNMQDREAKGRGNRGKRQGPGKLQKFCRRGHEFTPENTRVGAKGRRCRKCQAMHARDYYWQAKEREGNVDFKIGDKVIRKSEKDRVAVGTVVAIQGDKLRVRWPMARLHGSNSIHTTIHQTFVILATDEIVNERRTALKAKREAYSASLDARRTWECDKCGPLYGPDDVWKQVADGKCRYCGKDAHPRQQPATHDPR